MDSQDLQSSDFSRRMRTANPAIQPAVNQSGAVQKRSIARNRSTSASQAERFRQFLLEQPHHTRQSSPPGGVLDQQWLTPLNSPRPQLYTEQSLASLSKWTAPTPPRSDSGLAFVSPDACRDVVNTTCISPSLDLDFARSTASADMRLANVWKTACDSTANVREALLRFCYLHSTAQIPSSTTQIVRIDEPAPPQTCR